MYLREHHGTTVQRYGEGSHLDALLSAFRGCSTHRSKNGHSGGTYPSRCSYPDIHDTPEHVLISPIQTGSKAGRTDQWTMPNRKRLKDHDSSAGWVMGPISP